MQHEGIESGEVSGRMRGEGGGAGFGVENKVGDGGSYGHRTGGLNLGGQHFNNRWTTGIPEVTKSRTGTRRIIARSDHQKMITSDPGPSRFPLAAPYHSFGEPDSSRQECSGREIRFLLSSGRWGRPGLIRDFKSRRLAPSIRFTRNNDCGHVSSISLFANHVLPSHLIPSVASPQRHL